MRVIATAIVVIVVIMLAGLAFIYSGIYYVGADRPHWSATAWLFNEARIRSVRAHASAVAVPPGLDKPEVVVAGVSHYAEHCATCHGAPGVEREDLAEGLYPRPPDLKASARVWTPAELFWIIKHGIRMTGMPSWGDHTDDELWATVAFIQRLPGMSKEDYAKLVAAAQAHGGHHHGDHGEPAAGATHLPDHHDHPSDHQH